MDDKVKGMTCVNAHTTRRTDRSVREAAILFVTPVPCGEEPRLNPEVLKSEAERIYRLLRKVAPSPLFTALRALFWEDERQAREDRNG
jgi:hypothetical protein